MVMETRSEKRHRNREWTFEDGEDRQWEELKNECVCERKELEKEERFLILIPLSGCRANVRRRERERELLELGCCERKQSRKEWTKSSGSRGGGGGGGGGKELEADSHSKSWRVGSAAQVLLLLLWHFSWTEFRGIGRPWEQWWWTGFLMYYEPFEGISLSPSSDLMMSVRKRIGNTNTYIRALWERQFHSNTFAQYIDIVMMTVRLLEW